MIAVGIADAQRQRAAPRASASAVRRSRPSRRREAVSHLQHRRLGRDDRRQRWTADDSAAAIKGDAGAGEVELIVGAEHDAGRIGERGRECRGRACRAAAKASRWAPFFGCSGSSAQARWLITSAGPSAATREPSAARARASSMREAEPVHAGVDLDRRRAATARISAHASHSSISGSELSTGRRSAAASVGDAAGLQVRRGRRSLASGATSRTAAPSAAVATKKVRHPAAGERRAPPGRADAVAVGLDHRGRLGVRRERRAARANCRARAARSIVSLALTEAESGADPSGQA